MTQATMHSHSVLEEVIYQLQSKGAIVDPCIVDDLITCIKTHRQIPWSSFCHKLRHDSQAAIAPKSHKTTLDAVL